MHYFTLTFDLFVYSRIRLPANVYIGKDTDGDGIPDQPLRFEMEDSKSVIQFPLGFCPGAAKENFVYSNSDKRNRRQNATQECQGQWGLVLKEWETITAVRFFIYTTIQLPYL